MNDFLSQAWRAVLTDNRLDDFESFWNLDVPWFEAPNRRRGGWSGIARLEFAAADGGRCCVFLKRQENHRIFSWRHPFKGVPTFLREYQSIQRYRAAGIPTLDPVYFAMRQSPGGHRAILVTAELAGFAPLDEHVRNWQRDGPPSPARRRQLLSAVADLTRKIHDNRIQHNCYYPKHLFIRIDAAGAVEARVIDLEKSRWRPFSFLCALRDLDTLNRHSPNWQLKDRLRFLKYYLGIEKMNLYAKWLWKTLSARFLAEARH